MNDPVNLGRARKKKARREKAAKADENRVAFGRTRAEKEKRNKQAVLAAKCLDSKRLEKDD